MIEDGTPLFSLASLSPYDARARAHTLPPSLARSVGGMITYRLGEYVLHLVQPYGRRLHLLLELRQRRRLVVHDTGGVGSGGEGGVG